MKCLIRSLITHVEMNRQLALRNIGNTSGCRFSSARTSPSFLSDNKA
jgi:hypothetical protein